MSRVNQPVLQLLPARARSVGPSAGLLEGPDGGVVFVFGLATFSYASADAAGRRLAAVQLVTTKIASVAESRPHSGSTRPHCGAEAGLRHRRGVGAGDRASRPAASQQAHPVHGRADRAAGRDRSDIATDRRGSRSVHSDGPGRVGRVAPRDQAPVEDDVDEPEDDTGNAELIVLAAPVPRHSGPGRGPVRGPGRGPGGHHRSAQLPLAGLLLALPALEMTGLLPRRGRGLPADAQGLLRAAGVLLMGVFLALLREPRAEAATRIRPADLGRVLGLDRAPEVKTLRRKLTELAGYCKGAALQAALGRHHATTRPDAVGFLYLDGHVRCTPVPGSCPRPHRPDADRRPGHRGDLGRGRRRRPGDGDHCGPLPVVSRRAGPDSYPTCAP